MSLKFASIDEIPIDLIKSGSLHGKQSVSRSLDPRNNYCGLANGNSSPYLQKGRPKEVLQLQTHYSVKFSLCKNFREERRFRAEQLTNLCTLRQDSDTLNHRQRPQRLSDHWQPFALSTMIVKALILIGLRQGCVCSEETHHTRR